MRELMPPMCTRNMQHKAGALNAPVDALFVSDLRQVQETKGLGVLLKRIVRSQALDRILDFSQEGAVLFTSYPFQHEETSGKTSPQNTRPSTPSQHLLWASAGMLQLPGRSSKKGAKDANLRAGAVSPTSAKEAVSASCAFVHAQPGGSASMQQRILEVVMSKAHTCIPHSSNRWPVRATGATAPGNAFLHRARSWASRPIPVAASSICLPEAEVRDRLCAAQQEAQTSGSI